MEKLKVFTINPTKIIDEINFKISSKEIKTWEFDGKSKISHKGEQYKGHFEFEYNINKAIGNLEFIYHSKGNAYADSKAFSLLESMLKAHFEGRIEIYII